MQAFQSSAAALNGRRSSICMEGCTAFQQSVISSNFSRPTYRIRLDSVVLSEEKRKEEEMDDIKGDEAPRTEDGSDSLGQALSLEVKEAVVFF